MVEIELKFQVPEAARRVVEAAVAAGNSRRTRLQAIYFDTPDRRLSAAGLALRLRKEGGRWVQTLKAAGPNAMQRFEHNVPLLGAMSVPAGVVPGVDPLRHAGTPGGEALATALAAHDDDTAPPRLVALFRTDIWRRTRALRTAGGTVELAFDSGEIVAGQRPQADDPRRPLSEGAGQPGSGPSLPHERRLAVCELEIELLRGRPSAVIAVARRWVRRHGLWLDVRSKALQGDRLARDAMQGEAVKAGAVTLDPALGADAAFHAVVAHCLQQILPNASEVAGGLGGDEPVHQLRVGLRRLRSALRFFAGWTVPPDPAWAERLSRLFRQLGAARDRDALAESLLPALRKAGAPLFELPAASVGPAPTELLRGGEATLLLLDLLAYQIGGPALPVPPPGGLAAPKGGARRALRALESSAVPAGDAPTMRAEALPGPQPAASLQAVAVPAAALTQPDAFSARLQRWHRRVLRASKQYAELDDPARHALRKRVKRLRYAAEFAASLYKGKAVARYLKLLAPVQDSLGRYNDLCVGLETYRRAVGNDPRAWFAIGWLTARREVLLAESAAALRRFARCVPFWKPR